MGSTVEDARSAGSMPHLPNEIWLLIASHCNPQDLWLSIRPVNNQLQQCAEQYFKNEILPHTILSLSVVLPPYDVRVSIRGKVVFTPMLQGCDPNMASNFSNATYCMKDTDPGYYCPQFLSRWAIMQNRETGPLDERRTKWELELEGQRHPVGLQQTVTLKERVKHGDAWVSFDWKRMMNTYFMSVA